MLKKNKQTKSTMVSHVGSSVFLQFVTTFRWDLNSSASGGDHHLFHKNY